jgi:hypothetical protein
MLSGFFLHNFALGQIYILLLIDYFAGTVEPELQHKNLSATQARAQKQAEKERDHMDLSVKRDTVRVSEPVFDAVSDHPVDCDIILPDYCPDIARILKTEAEACIDAKTIETGRLTIDGSFCVKVIYIPENSRHIRCVTHETPFSHSFDIKDDGGKMHAHATVRVAFVNCRPVGPRRVQIRASLAVSAKVWSERDDEFISGCENEQVELLRRPMMASTFIGATDRQFVVHEELEIGFGKPAVAQVIKSQAVAMMQDFKLISNKVITKGELLIKTLYTVDDEEDGTGSLETMENSIPLSQIIDLEGIDEECGCDVKFFAGFVKAEPKPDTDGENKILDVELTVTASVTAWRTQQFFAVSDAYSPQYDMDLKTKEITFESMSEHIKTNEIVRQTIELNDMQVSSVTDSSVTANITSTRFDGTALEIAGDMSISVIAVDTSGGPAGIEKIMPFTLREELKNSSETMRCEPDIKVVSSGFSLTGIDRIDMRIECTVDVMVFSVSKENAIVAMSLDDASPKACGREKTLTLYYADRGERIWDIAKRYNTSMEAVKRENNLEADSLENRSMLLIPKKRCART